MLHSTYSQALNNLQMLEPESDLKNLKKLIYIGLCHKRKNISFHVVQEEENIILSITLINCCRSRTYGFHEYLTLTHQN